MFNFKSQPPISKKHQEKLDYQLNHSNPVKPACSNDNIIDMVLKNLKPKINSPDSFKSSDKNTDSKVMSQESNFISHQVQSVNKSPKRKDEKANHSVKKKVKSDTSQKSASTAEGSSTKKQNKSMYPKTYICKYCCRRYQSVELLRQHTSTDHGDKPSHVCHLCSHQAASFSALMTHYLKHSGNKKDNVDKIYAKSKADFSNIQFNMFSRPKSSFQCHKCKTTFSSKSKYDAHSCSEKSEYNCSYCHHVSTTVEEYRNHIQTHSETIFICSHCKYKAVSQKQLDAHQEHCKKQPKSVVEFKCNKCNLFQGKSKKELNHHLKNCRENASSHTCATCRSEFSDKKEYESHILVCKNKDKPKSCAKKIVKYKKKAKDPAAEKNKLICCVCDCVCYSKSEHEEHESVCLTEMVNKTSDRATSLCSSANRDKLTECIENGTAAGEKPANNDGTRRSARLVRRKSSCFEDGTVRRRRRSSYLEDRPVRRRSSFLEDEVVDRKNSCIEDEIVEKKSPRVEDEVVEKKRPCVEDEVAEKKSACNENEDVKKSPKPLKIKISKKSKILLKPKHRKGRQSKNTNNSFLCNYCDFTFCSKSTLLRHKRMHSGNPWYICQFCGKFFFRKDVYIRHEMNVHKNSLKNVFCCYYCKLTFGQSSLLQEHVVSTHKDSAFLPIKQNFLDKNSVKPFKTDIKIKEEPGTIKIEMSESDSFENKDIKKRTPSKKNIPLNNSSLSNLSSFKCTICSEAFENASALETHVKLNHETKEFSKTYNSQVAYKQSPTKKHRLLNKSPPKVTESTKETNNSMHDLSMTATSQEISKDDDVWGENEEVNATDATDNEFSDIGELAVQTDSSAELSQPLNCQLCSKQFTSRNLFEAHGKAQHKIVDWYQCLVCTASGPKQEILEHMLTHMYKVGTFVVSSKEDYSQIISSFETEKQQKKSAEHSGNHYTKQSTSESENTDLVSEADLPPLREYGLCPCVDGSSKQNEDSEKQCSENIEENSENNEKQCSENIEENLESSEKQCSENIEENFESSGKQCFEDIEENFESSEKQCSENIEENFESSDKQCSENIEENFESSEKQRSENIEENLESANEVETFACFQGNSESCTDVNDGRNTPSNESMNVSVENPSETLDTQDVCNKSSDMYDEKEMPNIEKANPYELSSPVKEYSESEIKSDMNDVVDCNQSESFSHLRYLLQNPNAQHTPEKNSMYPFSQLDSSNFTFNKHNLPLKLTNQESLSSDAISAVHKNELNFELSKQSVNSNESSKMLSMQENNQSINTCLKFDVNQSRSVFSENLTTTTTSSQKIQNCVAEMDKNENFFKACPSQSAILDFSDLLQHSFEISSPSDDNIFSYAAPKEVDSHNVGTRGEVRTPDCTDMVNYDSSGYNISMRCERCHTLFANLNEQINHKCLAHVSEHQSLAANYQYKPKNMFQSFASVENQNKTSDIDDIHYKRINIAPVDRQAGLFVCSLCPKIFILESELIRHQKIEHCQSLHSASHNMCTKCHRTFSDIGELMKHSLTCLKTYFLKSAVNDSISTSESVQSLHRKDETKATFSNFSINSASPFSAVPTDLSLSRQTSENVLKHNSFDS